MALARNPAPGSLIPGVHSMAYMRSKVMGNRLNHFAVLCDMPIEGPLEKVHLLELLLKAARQIRDTP